MLYLVARSVRALPPGVCCTENVTEVRAPNLHSTFTSTGCIVLCGLGREWFKFSHVIGSINMYFTSIRNLRVSRKRMG